MDPEVAEFVAITGADPRKALSYLELTDQNLEQAIQLYFDSPNLDFGEEAASGTSNAQNPIQIDSDDERSENEPRPSGSTARHDTIEDDEAMARRLQDEMYGGSEPEVRAPITRVRETLVGPDAFEDDDMLIAEQMASRRRPAGRPGIFNQQQRSTQASVWESTEDPDARRRELATATGGASEADRKSNMLAQMYRPPFEIMFQRSWEQARDEGKEKEKWLLVNIQDPAIFDCQILNRDIWKNEEIKATIRENFVFMQYSKDDPRGQQYNNYYFTARDSQDAYPHIAIVDPRTGEQVKVWSGPPVPSPVEFHAELHEFLDRYSLKANARNPVAMRKPERKKVDVNRMTEEEMLEMALQNSLANSKGPTEEDPDALTKDTSGSGKGKGRADEHLQEEEEMDIDTSASPFAEISDEKPHTEPPASADPKTTTRIKFTSSGQQKVRKFYLNDSVRTIYEWIKSGGWEGKEGLEFDLISQRKNLIESLDLTIEQAGLKGSVVNVEFTE